MMKKIRRVLAAVFPYALALVILAGGSVLALFIREQMLDFDGGIISVDAESHDGGRTDLYPWMHFSDEDVPFEEWLDSDDFFAYVPVNNQTKEGIIESVASNVTVTVNQFLDDFGERVPSFYDQEIGHCADFLKVHKGDGTTRYFYIEDMPLVTASAKDYRVSIVWLNEIIIHLDIAPAEGGRADGESAADAVRHLEALREYREPPSSFYQMYNEYYTMISELLYGPDFTSDAVSEGIPYYEPTDELLSNPAAKLFTSIAYTYLQNGTTNLYRIYEAMDSGEYYTAEIDGRVHIVINSASYMGQWGLDLCYDAALGAFTGFTLYIY